MSKKIVPIIGILNKKFSDDSDNIYVEGTCITKLVGSNEAIDTSLIRLAIPTKENAGTISFEKRYGTWMPLGARLNKFKIAFNKDEVINLDIQNKLIIKYKDEYDGRLLYSARDLKTGTNHNSPVVIHNNIAIYFRQTSHNAMWLTVRDANQYDYPDGQARIQRAYDNAKKLARNNLILMYEKNCARYEESASVLYEKLIDAGYDNVYYVVNFDNLAIKDLPEKYRKNLIEKDSDKHLEHFFASNTFIATESTEHALQLRVASKLAMDKVKSKNLQYVFLQHGVMYMVSLNSEMRTGFRNSGFKLQRTVVSSQTEANHFIEFAGMNEEDLYVTGLAKFDKCYRNETADKIIIMLTWRRWETNQARTDLEGTKYYKMIERIFNAVPDELKDKVVILPHPLMAERFKNKSGLGKHILLADSYDEVLRDCDILITDYSSIAYDAFYRGANVVFCWDEKDECMEHYGEGSFLMLNEENVFGPVCMNQDEIRTAISDYYGTTQTQKNIDKYRHIVEFHDGKNSERIMKLLVKDGLIEERKN